MRKKLSLCPAALVFALFAGHFAAVFACTCGGDQKPCNSYYDSDLVFAGKMLGTKKQKIRYVKRMPYWAERAGFKLGDEIEIDVAEFEVSEIFGSASKIERVTMVSDYTTCDVSFEKDESYLVYASKTDEGLYTTDTCTRTGPLSGAREDLKFLRETLPNPVQEICVGASPRLGMPGILPTADNAFWPAAEPVFSRIGARPSPGLSNRFSPPAFLSD